MFSIHKLLLSGRLFIVLGSIAALVGIGLGLWSASFWFGTVSTYGTITRLEMQRSASSGKYNRASVSYVPVVNYQVQGKPYTHKGAIALQPSPYRVGQQVRVLYRAARPSVAYIDSFADRWLLPLVFTGMGSLFVLVGTLMARQKAG